MSEGRPNIQDMIERGELQLIINTPLLTTLSAAAAAVNGITALRAKDLKVRSLQQHFALAD